MNVSLRYGQDEVSVDVPKSAEVTLIRKPKMPIIDNTSMEIDKILSNAVGAGVLGELINVAKTACILICDITRPVPNNLFLRPLINKLVNLGIALDNITILIATGLHRPNEGKELEIRGY